MQPEWEEQVGVGIGCCSPDGGNLFRYPHCNNRNPSTGTRNILSLRKCPCSSTKGIVVITVAPI